MTYECYEVRIYPGEVGKLSRHSLEDGAEILRCELKKRWSNSYIEVKPIGKVL